MASHEGRISHCKQGWKRRLPRLIVLTIFAGIFSVTGSAQVQSGSVAADTDKQTAAQPQKATLVADKPVLPANPETLRQKQLADDTAKLLVLANELKAEMDKSTKDTLSLSVMKKAEEIEKLARKVRGEMKASIGN
jgi:hypothetical protein